MSEKKPDSEAEVFTSLAIEDEEHVDKWADDINIVSVFESKLSLILLI